MKIEIKNIFERVIFSHEEENNTAKKTVEEAVRKKISLSYANLSGVNLHDANLNGANLSDANLYGANLSGTDLSNANLSGADFSWANLHRSNLYGANLHRSNLSGANLCGCDFRSTNFRWTNVYGADLRGIVFDKYTIFENWFFNSETKYDDSFKRHFNNVPEGDIIVYKKCKDEIIVKLLIPKEAKRSKGFTNKCRAEFAEVLEIYEADEAKSMRDYSFIYKVGEIVKPEFPFNKEWYIECESGIHFFLTKEEAKNY